MPSISISEFFDVLSQSQKIYTKHLEPVCRKWKLTRNELDVLLFLYNNPGYDRAADIVVHRGMTKSHVSLSVSNLEQRSLLERAPSEEDRRTVHLRLTETGREIAMEGREAQQRFFGQLYSGVSEEEFRLFKSVTKKVQKNIADFNKI